MRAIFNAAVPRVLMMGALSIGVLIGAAAAPAQAQSLLRDEEIERLLREYTNPLLEAANLRAADTHIYLVGDSSINAFVAGGQNMFMNTGTILEAETPNQLKGVIAHEIGHIAGGHLSRTRGAQAGAIGAMLATMGAGLLATMAGAADAGMTMIAGAQQMGAASMASFTYVQESAADQAGVSYMERTGQSGRGVLQFFDKLRMRELMRDRRSGSFYGDFFRSHPTSSDRISALRARVEASDFVDAQDSEEDIRALRMIQAKIYGFMEAPGRALRRYPDTDVSAPARYARAAAHFRNGSLDSALAEIDSLIADEPENPYFWELKGQMLYESGRPADSLAPYREAVRLMPDSGLLHTGLGQSLVATRDPGNQEEAIASLRLAVALDREMPLAWYQLSQIYERMGERAQAELAVAEQSYAMGDYRRAVTFARRAQEELDHGGMDWRRATDIVAVSESLVRDQPRERRLTIREY